MGKTKKNKNENIIMKCSTKALYLLALAVICASSKSMSIKELIQEEFTVHENEFKDTIHKKRTFLENNSEDVAHKKRTFSKKNSIVSSANVPVPYGAFVGWHFKQTYLVGKCSEKYVAKCFAKNCSKKIEAPTKSLSDEALINHLNTHLQNDVNSPIAEKIMRLRCKNPIFSIKINLPIVQLCKDSKGIYYTYKCNICKKTQGRKDKAFKLNYDCKVHLSACCKREIQKVLDDNKQKKLLSCCLQKKYLNRHLWFSHFKVEDK